MVGETLQHRVLFVVRIDDFAQTAAGVANKMRVSVDVFSAFDELRYVEQRTDFRHAVLRLTPTILVERNPAECRVARLPQVGGERTQILERDVGADVDRIRAQQLAQEGIAHRLPLEVVDDVLVHVSRADAIVDGVLEPVVLLQQAGEGRLAHAGHAEKGHGMGRLVAEGSSR